MKMSEATFFTWRMTFSSHRRSSRAFSSGIASDIFIQEAWARGQALCVHGWVYSLETGIVNDLGVTVGDPDDLERLG